MTVSDTPSTVSITVTLFAELRQYLPDGADGPFSLELVSGATVEEVLSELGVPGDVEITVGLNGELGARDNQLRDGDDLQLFTPMQGG
jgi:sulfur carrier protein ThiS